MKGKLLLAVVAAIVLTLTGLEAAGGPATEAEEAWSRVLDRFVDAVGGRAALEQVQIRHYRGTIVQDLSWKEPQQQETPFVAEADTSSQSVESDT